LYTDPLALLRQLESQGISSKGWGVCRILVRDILTLGLQVVPDPTDADRGHCLIIGTEQRPLSRGASSALAMMTRVLTPDEMHSLQEGGSTAD
jgi:hypothetical protein